MYNLIPIILILVSLSVIIVIVVRKFSALASLDVENIPAEKENIVKERIISTRFKRNIIKWSSKILAILRFISEKGGVLSRFIFNKLIELKDRYAKEEVQQIEDKEEKIEKLYKESQELVKEEYYQEAEKKLIEIIGLDSKNLASFKALGGLYYQMKKHEEALETFKHALKLIQEDKAADPSQEAEIYFNLALAHKEKENFKEALDELKKVLKIEPNNPRFLDTALEISIIKKDKSMALDAYEKLKEANPENKKLDEWKRKIKNLWKYTIIPITNNP